MTPTRLVTALAVAAALAGCSGDPEPRVAPTEAPSVSASPERNLSSTLRLDRSSESCEQFVDGVSTSLIDRRPVDLPATH